MAQKSKTKKQETKQEPVAQNIKTIGKHEQVKALTEIYQYFSNYDRISGSAATTWGRALDTIALVTNSIVVEVENESKKAK